MKSINGIEYTRYGKDRNIFSDKIGDYINVNGNKVYLNEIYRLETPWINGKNIDLINGDTISAMLPYWISNNDIFAAVIYGINDKIRLYVKKTR